MKRIPSRTIAFILLLLQSLTVPTLQRGNDRLLLVNAIFNHYPSTESVVRVGNVTLSPLAFDLEHESAQRVQLVQTSEFIFEVRAELFNHENPDQVFEQIIQSVSEVFAKNGLIDVKVEKSDAPPHLTASGKFHEVIPLQ